MVKYFFQVIFLFSLVICLSSNSTESDQKNSTAGPRYKWFGLSFDSDRYPDRNIPKSFKENNIEYTSSAVNDMNKKNIDYKDVEKAIKKMEVIENYKNSICDGNICAFIKKKDFGIIEVEGVFQH